MQAAMPRTHIPKLSSAWTCFRGKGSGQQQSNVHGPLATRLYRHLLQHAASLPHMKQKRSAPVIRRETTWDKQTLLRTRTSKQVTTWSQSMLDWKQTSSARATHRRSRADVHASRPCCSRENSVGREMRMQTEQSNQPTCKTT